MKLTQPILLLLLQQIRKCTLEVDSSPHHYKTKPKRQTAPSEWEHFLKPLQTFVTPQNISKEYDFIIVGSGSAGSVIANRLSEINNWRILLLEAGVPENIWSQVPFAAPAMVFTPYNWNYSAEYQHNTSSGLNDNRILWPRGKALGGSTVINFMMYTRGNRLDFDRWAAQGNPGWSYQDVLPYFIKSERANLKEADCRYHGSNGYLSVESIYRSPLLDNFIKGAKELWLPHYDYNANVGSIGVSAIQATVLNGRRHSVAQAFLHPVRHRSNLDILTSAFVTQVLIDPDTKQAYGVAYERFGKTYTVGARKEVILSAGTFNSPQLLMLAGIGPRQHLQELDIPVLKDLPVGQTLQDHLAFPGLSFLINKDISISLYKIIEYKNFYDFFMNGRGPYTGMGIEGIGYIKTEESQETDDVPDIELISLGGSLSSDLGLLNRRWMNIRDDVYNSLFASTQHIPSYAVFPMLLHPKSKGYLKLRSKNPHDYPLLYGNYLTDPQGHDLKTLVAAIRFIQRLSKTKVFRKLGATINKNHMPGCEQYKFDSDDYWKCAIRAIGVTFHHQMGTARMGPAHDPNSVVDHELRVHGIKGLRVSDCSVIPLAVGAHTNAVAIMIGEKTSDIIKKNYGEVIEPLSKYNVNC